MTKPATFFLAFLTLISASGCNALMAMEDGTVLIKNSEIPNITVNGAETVYRYSDCVVTTSKGEEGDKITVKTKNGEPFEFCEIDMNTYFYGIQNNIMFLLTRGGLFPSLTGFNLDELDMDPYDEFPIRENGAEVDGSKLIVWRVMEWAPPAIETQLASKVEQLEEQEMQVFFVRKESYDYATKEHLETENYDCVGVSY